MKRALSVLTRLGYVVGFPLFLPLRLAGSWLRVRRELRGVEWSRETLRMAVHESALMVWPPVAAAGAWLLYWASGWGPGGAGGDVRGAVLGWVGASLVVLAVQGARYGEGANEDYENAAPEYLARYTLGYAAAFSGYLVVVQMLVLVPLALILSI